MEIRKGAGTSTVKKDSVNFNPHMFETDSAAEELSYGKVSRKYKVCAFSDAASCGEFSHRFRQ